MLSRAAVVSRNKLLLSTPTASTFAKGIVARSFNAGLSNSATLTVSARSNTLQTYRLLASSAAAEVTSTSNSSSTESSVDKNNKKQEQKSFSPSDDRRYEFFRNVEITDSGVAIVKFDGPKPVNTISFALAKEAQKLWENEIKSNSNIKAVVFTSAKSTGFIAGADIYDIQSLENKKDLEPIIADGVKFFQQLREKKVPLVAAIDGPALGGGLEWALWCDYRICTDSSKTKLGLPEVKLGLLPGFGGTQNLPRLVGLQKALDMMLTGKDIRPSQAKKMGLVDLVVAPASLESAAISAAEQLASGSLKAKRAKKPLMQRLLEDNSLGQRVIWYQVQKMVEKNTDGKYPAPYKIIEAIKSGLGKPNYTKERELFVKLAETPESEALIGIFDGMTKLKKHDLGESRPVHTVAVMGAGLMGAGIAQVTAQKGLQVLLKDRNDAAVDRGLSYMRDNWGKKLKRRHMTQYEYNSNMSNVVPLTDNIPSWKKHFERADMIIEAVFEDLSLKKKIVADMEAVSPEHCIFATNTSAIPIADIAEGSKRPQNIIGMHYFSPVPSMPLLEIIPHEGTSDVTKATAYEIGTKQGKTCILVKDVPGFYVNRCLGPYLVEVSALVRDGIGLEKLDKAIRNFGMPVGPITLADEVGMDVTSHVANFLSKADLGVRMTGGDVSLMEKMVEKGWLGKKSGKGFYTYQGKKKSINKEAETMAKQFATQQLKIDETEIQDRIMTRFINEAAKCLEDEIIDNPVVGDIGLVFGTGFAPFRGGPFRYLDQYGVSKYVDRMNHFTDKYGPQFEPCQLLQDHAKQNKKFHSK